MHNLIIYAPFDINFELDLRPFMSTEGGVPCLSGKLAELVSKLSKTTDVWEWEGGLSDDGEEGILAYRGKRYRAPSKRPPYFCSAQLRNDSDLCEELALGAQHDLALISVEFTFQDYGIGVAEYVYAILPEAGQHAPSTFAKSIRELCSTLSTVTNRCGMELAQPIHETANQLGFEYSSDMTSLVHRNCRGIPTNNVQVRAMWTHSLVVLDNRDGSLGAIGGKEWRDDMDKQCMFPRSESFFSDAFSFKCVKAVPFVTRDVEATAIFGWGNSALIITPNSKEGDVEALVPLRYVMRILQCFTASLYILNSDLLNEILFHSSSKQGLSYKEYCRRGEVTDNQRLRADVFLSLMSEQRYSQSAHEMSLWSAAVNAWETDTQILSIQRNIDLLQKLYTKRRAKIEDRVREKITTAVTIITVASAAAIVFDMIDTVLAGPEWDKFIYQSVVLTALLVLALYLILSKKR